MNGRFLLDEMFPVAIGQQLAKRGHSARSVQSDRALIGTSDVELLEIATHDNRNLVTRNIEDFVIIAKELGAARRPHAGIILVPTTRFPDHPNGFATLVKALDANSRNALLPGANGVLWLR